MKEIFSAMTECATEAGRVARGGMGYEMFGAAVEVDDDADVFTRAVAASGRDPHWAAAVRS
ncbi:hypothetical protein [Nocardia sp. NPDC020380]|uniref:hypothetical protein n=1 Tax=Nocardia sp. NPDC020380 TaxID=3364309 RepID=UPI0037892C86